MQQSNVFAQCGIKGASSEIPVRFTVSPDLWSAQIYGQLTLDASKEHQAMLPSGRWSALVTITLHGLRGASSSLQTYDPRQIYGQLIKLAVISWRDQA